MTETQNKPIVIDIQLKKASPVRSPPIAMKLKMGQSNDSAPTLEDIQEKLLRAEMNRREEFAKKATKHIEEKRQNVLQRKIDNERDLQEKTLKQMEQKREAADQLRQELLIKRVNLAHRETEKREQALNRIEASGKDMKTKLQ